MTTEKAQVIISEMFDELNMGRSMALAVGHEQKELLESQLHRAANDLTAETAMKLERNVAELQGFILNAAPGLASSDLSVWRNPEAVLVQPAPATLPSWIRLGEAKLRYRRSQDSRVPVIFPLLDQGNLMVSSASDRLEDGLALISNVLMRVLATTAPGSVKIRWYDPHNLGSSLDWLSPLIDKGLVDPPVITPNGLGDLLEDVAEHIARVSTSVVAGSHASLGDFVRATKTTRDEPWQLLVILDSLSAREQEKLKSRLHSIARVGPDKGLCVLMLTQDTDEEDIPRAFRVNLSDLTQRSHGAMMASSPQLGNGWQFFPDGLAAGENRQNHVNQVEAVLAALEAARPGDKTSLDLLPAGEYWQETAAESIQVPVGFDPSTGEPLGITLGDNPVHALIAGPSGTGKSTMLDNFIMGIGARYRPSEVQLYLLDYKDGNAFGRYARIGESLWLPHVQAVAVDSDPQFGLATFRALEAERSRRAKAQTRAGVDTFHELREKHPNEEWPRIVLIVDEFQGMFADKATSGEIVGLLDSLARKGRSAGIHMILASQTSQGISALLGQGSAIFAQFQQRVALPRAPRELLGVYNNAQEDLPAYHAIINDQGGEPQGNRIAKLPNKNASALDPVLAAACKEWPETGKTQQVFDGRQSEALPEHNLDDSKPDNPRIPLGAVIDIKPEPYTVTLDRSHGKNIAFLGDRGTETVDSIRAAAWSLGQQANPDDQFIVLAAHPDTFELAKTIASDASNLGLATDTVLGASESVAAIRNINQRTEVASSRTYIVFLGIEASQPYFEERDEDRKQAIDDFRNLLKYGAERGTHIIGWWRMPSRLNDSLGPNGRNDIGAWIAFNVAPNELPGGITVASWWNPQPFRILAIDKSATSEPRSLIPYALSLVEAETEQLLSADVSDEDLDSEPAELGDQSSPDDATDSAGVINHE